MNTLDHKILAMAIIVIIMALMGLGIAVSNNHQQPMALNSVIDTVTSGQSNELPNDPFNLHFQQQRQSVHRQPQSDFAGHVNKKRKLENPQSHSEGKLKFSQVQHLPDMHLSQCQSNLFGQIQTEQFLEFPQPDFFIDQNFQQSAQFPPLELDQYQTDQLTSHPPDYNVQYDQPLPSISDQQQHPDEFEFSSIQCKLIYSDFQPEIQYFSNTFWNSNLQELVNQNYYQRTNFFPLQNSQSPQPQPDQNFQQSTQFPPLEHDQYETDLLSSHPPDYNVQYSQILSATFDSQQHLDKLEFSSFQAELIHSASEPEILPFSNSFCNSDLQELESQNYCQSTNFLPGSNNQSPQPQTDQIFQQSTEFLPHEHDLSETDQLSSHPLDDNVQYSQPLSAISDRQQHPDKLEFSSSQIELIRSQFEQKIQYSFNTIWDRTLMGHQNLNAVDGNSDLRCFLVQIVLDQFKCIELNQRSWQYFFYRTVGGDILNHFNRDLLLKNLRDVFEINEMTEGKRDVHPGLIQVTSVINQYLDGLRPMDELFIRFRDIQVCISELSNELNQFISKLPSKFNILESFEDQDGIRASEKHLSDEDNLLFGRILRNIDRSIVKMGLLPQHRLKIIRIICQEYIDLPLFDKTSIAEQHNAFLQSIPPDGSDLESERVFLAIKAHFLETCRRELRKFRTFHHEIYRGPKISNCIYPSLIVSLRACSKLSNPDLIGDLYRAVEEIINLFISGVLTKSTLLLLWEYMNQRHPVHFTLAGPLVG